MLRGINHFSLRRYEVVGYYFHKLFLKSVKLHLGCIVLFHTHDFSCDFNMFYTVSLMLLIEHYPAWTQSFKLQGSSLLNGHVLIHICLFLFCFVLFCLFGFFFHFFVFFFFLFVCLFFFSLF